MSGILPPTTQPISEPTWEIAHLFPHQGAWTMREYLALQTNRRVEFNRGYVEFLPMPTERHQDLILALCDLLRAFVLARGLGKVSIAGLRVSVSRDRMREPDVVFMFEKHRHRRGNDYWDGADLVMEVVSPDDPRRDLETKRQEYAEAGIPEYWIIDLRDQTVAVLALDKPGEPYQVAGSYAVGQVAESRLLPGFSVNVASLFTQT